MNPGDTYAAFIVARITDDLAGADDQHKLSCRRVGERDRSCDCGVPGRIRDWCTVGLRIVESAVYDADLWMLQKLAWPDRAHPDHPNHQETT